MKKFKLALLQTRCTANKQKNLEFIKQALNKAGSNGAQVSILGEICNSPYNKQFMHEFAQDFSDSPTLSLIRKQCAAYNMYAIGTIPRKQNTKYFNTAFVINHKGQLQETFDKIHLFDIDIPGKITYKQSDTFSPGNKPCVFDTEFCRFGLGICYDLRFPQLALLMAQRGARFIVYPGSFNHTTGPLHWELLLRGRALDNQCYVAGVSVAQFKTPSFKLIKSLTNDHHQVYVIVAPEMETTDQLLKLLADRFVLFKEEFITKVIVKGRKVELKLRIVQGMKLSSYINGNGSLVENVNNFQLQLLLEFIGNNSQLSQNKHHNHSLEDLPRSAKAEFYKVSHSLFHCLLSDDYLTFKSLISPYLVHSQFGCLLNLFHIDNGQSLLTYSIIMFKINFLEKLLSQFGQLLQINHSNSQGWLPLQLAILVGNRQAIQLILAQSSRIDLDINYASAHGTILQTLIDSVNIDLIQFILKKCPIRFQQPLQPMNQLNIHPYEYIMAHPRYSFPEKRHILMLMHSKYMEHFDNELVDQIMFSKIKSFIPEISRSIYSPKKRKQSAVLNMKIMSGQVVKVKNISSKKIFLSVNPIIGAIEEYQINQKVLLNSDKDKLESYEKIYHLSFEQIQDVAVIAEKDKSWYMKKEWFCFTVKEKRGNKHTFACKYQFSATQWVEEIKQSQRLWEEKEETVVRPSDKKYIHLADTQRKAHSSKRIAGPTLIDLFSKRLSLFQANQSKQSLTNTENSDVPMQKSKSHYTKPSSSMNQSFSLALHYKNFKLISMLGEGAFGQVFLANCTINGKLYALKVYQKKRLILSKQTKFLISQVNILKKINHPFIIALHFTFQTPMYIYLGLQYCPGKDLSKHLFQQVTFKPRDVKFYAAQIVLALQYIHSLGIIYRDLKPENIMLNKDGHIMLIDFGLSKQTDQNTFAKTFCGSPQYLPPEMIDRQGVGPQSDFFSLGVVIFQFLFGEPPFTADSVHELYNNIKNCRLSFPPNVKVDQETKSLLQGLLQKNPKLRIGSETQPDIKLHRYFAGIDWQRLLMKQIEAPKRTVIEDKQIQNFTETEQFLKMVHQDMDYNEQNYKTNRFKNFSFVRQEEFS